MFTWRMACLIALASVLNVLMWLAFSDEFRTDLLFDRSYPASIDFIIDFGITFLESGILCFTGYLSGKALAGYVQKFGKYGLPLVITAVFLLLFIFSAAVSYFYYGICGYYGYQDFVISVLILGTLSTLFTMVMLSDDMADMIRRMDSSRKETEERAAGTRRQLALTELERNNVLADNHFLFNSMGIIYSEIEEDPHEAMRTMETLMGVARYMSSNSNVPVVSLKDEVGFLKWYLVLTGKRHPYVTVDISGLEPDNGGYVVPMSIQGLVLNAIKHNAHGSCSPLAISVYERDSRITVRNRIQPMASEPLSAGRGLDLLKARYRGLTDEPVTVCREGDEFVVSIPLLFEIDIKTE